MKKLFCKHDWTHKNYSTFNIDIDKDNEKVVVADVYNIEECNKCKVLHKEKLYTKYLRTVDDTRDFVVEESMK